ncbi:trypsin-like serine protease [Vibrio sp. PNB22_8_1]|uniref:trypsin-like serine protease n=1 Tax=unclassified Vibrio TaxID=2614977 RepID=UPI00406A26F2
MKKYSLMTGVLLASAISQVYANAPAIAPMIAGSEGTVKEVDYKDFFVRLEIDTQEEGRGNLICGGTMLDNNVLMTAKHCLPDIDAATSYTITVSQGVDSTNPTGYYPNLPVMSAKVLSEVEDICESSYYKYEVYYGRHEGGPFDGFGDNYYGWSKWRDKSAFMADCATQDHSRFLRYLAPDMVIVTLGGKVDFSAAPVLAVTGDASEQYYEIGTEVMFRGWGSDAVNGGTLTPKMQEVRMRLEHVNTQVFMETDNPRSTPEWLWSWIRVECDPSVAAMLNCYLEPLEAETYTSVSDDMGSAAPGDSGTPVVIGDNTVLGVVRGGAFEAGPNGETLFSSVNVTAFGPYWGWITKAIDRLVLPTQFVAKASGVSTYQFTVQNVSSGDKALSLVSGEFEPGLNVTTDCPATLTSLAHCNVTLDVDVDQLGLTEGYAIALPVSSEQSLSVTALALAGDSSGSGSDDTTNEGSDDSSNENSDDSTDSDSSDTSSTGSSSGGSGGGSTGLFSLLLMGAYLLRRKMA